MLRRKAYDRLMNWKAKADRLPLLVKGQRQVGKTFIIERFAKDNYRNYIYADLSKDENARKSFSGNLDVNTIIQSLCMFRSIPVPPEKETVIFLDEIQSCPRARESLKSFAIDGRYDVIASGSLIDAVHTTDDGRPPVLPIGYEEHLLMHPLDFEEFLWAKNTPSEIISEIKENIASRTPISEAYLDGLQSLFREYMIVGGMPKAVSKYVSGGSYSEADEVIGEVLETCKADVTKYNDGIEGKKILDCLESMPSQLSQSNKRFMYSRIEKQPSRMASRKYSDALLWIADSGLGIRCFALKDLSLPLKVQCDRGLFRLYMSDTGMLMNMLGNTARVAVFDGDYSVNMGAVVENVVAGCLHKVGYEIYYRKVANGEEMMELDFVIELGIELAVIEVKSGKDRSAPSLGKVSRYPSVQRRIMLENGNIHVDGAGVEHYPLFAAAFMDKMEKDWRRPGF